MAKVASYDSVTFKVTELFSTTNSTSNVCLCILHCYVLDFVHLLAIVVAETLTSIIRRDDHIWLAI